VSIDRRQPIEGEPHPIDARQVVADAMIAAALPLAETKAAPRVQIPRAGAA